MEGRTRWIWLLAVVAVGVGVYLFTRSPSGEAAVEAIDNVSDQITGNRAVQQRVWVREEMQRIDDARKAQLEEIEESRSAR